MNVDWAALGQFVTIWIILSAVVGFVWARLFKGYAEYEIAMEKQQELKTLLFRDREMKFPVTHEWQDEAFQLDAPEPPKAA